MISAEVSCNQDLRVGHTPSGPAFETKRAASDPMLFPGKASDSLLAAMPPTIVWEEEFDMYITPATRSLHCVLLYSYWPG